MNMADRIRELRKTNGLSQEELAEKVGVSRQAVSKWESEQSTPDIEKIIAMSELFGITTDYILKGTEPVRTDGKRTISSLYLGFAVIFGSLAGIWSFSVNRFRIDECCWIAIAGAVIGFAIALVIQVISDLVLKKKSSNSEIPDELNQQILIGPSTSVGQRISKTGAC